MRLAAISFFLFLAFELNLAYGQYYPPVCPEKCVGECYEGLGCVCFQFRGFEFRILNYRLSYSLLCRAGYYGQGIARCNKRGAWEEIYYECFKCPEGWTSLENHNEHPENCDININECETNNPCKPEAICEDTEGSYICHCPEEGNYPQTAGDQNVILNSCNSGFYGESVRHCNLEGRWETIVEQCESCGSGLTSNVGAKTVEECYPAENGFCGTATCAPGSICSETGLGYFCSCPPDSGFSQTVGGQNAVPVPTCPNGQYGLSTRFCQENGEWDTIQLNCQNCPSGFTSNETVGYEGDCINVNECLNENICPPPSECQDTHGSYLCTCEPGYDFVGESCQPNNRTAFLMQYGPLARFLLDGRYTDATGNGHTLQIKGKNYQFESLYQRGNDKNQALRVLDTSIQTSGITTDNTLTIEVLFNIESRRKVSDLIAILPTNTSILSQSVLRVMADDKSRIVWYKSGDIKIGTSEKVLRYGVTHSLVVTIRGGKIVTFLNDVKLSTLDFSLTPGTYFFSSGSSVDGYIDELGIYDVGIFNPPGNSLNDFTRCINTCPYWAVCVNEKYSYECDIDYLKK